MSREFMCVAGVAACFAAGLVFSSINTAHDDTPQVTLLIEMPPKVAQRLENAIRNYPNRGRDSTNLRQAGVRMNALVSLEKLRKLRWPDYSKLRLVRVTDMEAKCGPTEIGAAWISPKTTDTIGLLTEENEFISLPSKRYRVEPISFERFWKSQRILLGFDQKNDFSDLVHWVTGSPTGTLQSRSNGYGDGIDNLHFLYLAAMFEKTDDLTMLLDRKLDCARDDLLKNTWSQPQTSPV